MAEQKTPTNDEAQDEYNPSSSGGFDAKSSDYEHDYQSRKKGLAHVMEHNSFDPTRVGLPKKFNLMSYADLRGSGAKVPRPELLALLKGVGQEDANGSDAAIVESNLYPGYFLVSTIDYFYSPVEDPYMTGWIAAQNVAADIYCQGCEYIDNVLMSLAASSEMPEKERFISTKQMMIGFDHAVKSMNSVVTGGQSVMNPWPLLGGIAKSICKEEDIIRNTQGAPGDVVVLTKPLGVTQCTDARVWQKDDEKWAEVKKVLSADEVERGYRVAEASMARSSVTVARLMHQYKSHGATDISGFGLIGESQKLAEFQRHSVGFKIHTLPVIKEARKIDKLFPKHGLLKGTSAESSGPIFVILPENQAQGFIDELSQTDKWPAWVIGDVVSGPRTSTIIDNPKIIEV